MATHNQMAMAVGRVAAIRENGLTILVRVLDAKTAYSVVRLLVTPVSGQGQAWVNAERVILEGVEAPATDSSVKLGA